MSDVAKSPRALVALGDTYQEAGRKQEAIETYRAVLEIEPEHGGVRRALEELQGTGK